MNMYLVSYADDAWEERQKQLVAEAKMSGFYHFFSYNESFVKKIPEYAKAKKALPNAGCIWKPYIILDAFTRVQYGDAVAYSDCGDGITTERNYSDFIRESLMEHGAYFVNTVWPNKFYTKEYCFRVMGCSDDKYRDGLHLEAGQLAFVKSDKNILFVKKWLKFCRMLDVLLDDDFGMKNEFLIRHSRDQSILTNLKIKHGYHAHENKEVSLAYVNYNIRG
jgi:hypothetical protein